MAQSAFVRVRLRRSYRYGGVHYGPGVLDVPVALASALGLVPTTVEQEPAHAGDVSSSAEGDGKADASEPTGAEPDPDAQPEPEPEQAKPERPAKAKGK